MTQTAPRPDVADIPEGLSNKRVTTSGNLFVEWLTTTDHKKVG